MRIFLIIADSWPSVDADIAGVENYRLPQQQVAHFNNLVEDYKKRRKDILFVRVYADTLINWLGEQIEKGLYTTEQISVIANDREFFFDRYGAIQGAWPFGIFNWSE